MRPSAMTSFVAVSLLAPLVAGVVVVVVASNESPLESAGPVGPVVGVVERAVRSDQAYVAVALELAEPFTARTDAAGRVTSVEVAAGDQVASGVVVATVAGRDVVAYQAARPLYVSVDRGARGDAARAAQEVLASLGFYAGPVDGVVGPVTAAAILAFNEVHGFGRSAVLDLAGLTWIGPDPVTVGEVLATPGEDVTAGAGLFIAEAVPSGVRVAATQAPAVPGDRVLDIAGLTAPLPGGTRIVEDAEFAAAVARVWGDVTEGVGVLRLAEPVEVGTVPSSAVVTDTRGRTCIFPDAEAGPVAVTPAGGSLGTVDLDVGLVGRPVLVNPRQVRHDLDCG